MTDPAPVVAHYARGDLMARIEAARAALVKLLDGLRSGAVAPTRVRAVRG